MDKLTEEEERTLNRVIFILHCVLESRRSEKIGIKKSYVCAILFGKTVRFEDDDVILN